MEIATPDAALFLLPDGTRTVKYAEHQPEYQTLPSLVTPDGKVVSCWKPNAGELELLQRGVPITLCVWTRNYPLQPVTIAIGGLDLR
jgi:hypothetical protein